MKKKTNSVSSKPRSSKIKDSPTPPTKIKSPQTLQPKPRKFYASSVLEARKREKAENIKQKTEEKERISSFTPKPAKIQFNDFQITPEQISEVNNSPERRIFTPQIYNHTMVSYCTSKNRILSPQKYNYEKELRKEKKLRKQKENEKREEQMRETSSQRSSTKTKRNFPKRNFNHQNSQNSQSNPTTTDSEYQSQEEPVIVLKKVVKVATKFDAINGRIDGVFLTENDLVDDSDSSEESGNNEMPVLSESYSENPSTIQSNYSESDLTNQSQSDYTYTSSAFISDAPKPINSSLEAQRNDTISYTSLSSIRKTKPQNKTTPARRPINTKQSPKELRDFPSESYETSSNIQEQNDSVLHFVFSSQSEKTETDLEKYEESYYTESEYSTQKRPSYSLNLLDSDAIEPINYGQSTQSSTQQQSSENRDNAFFISEESDLAPGQISILKTDFESSMMTDREDKSVISLKPEDIGIWLG